MELRHFVYNNALPAQLIANAVYYVYKPLLGICLQFVTTTTGVPIPVGSKYVSEIYNTTSGSGGTWSIDASDKFSEVVFMRATALHTTSDISERKIESHNERTGTGVTAGSGAILESDRNGILLGGMVEGLEAAEAGRGIEVLVLGVPK